MLSRLLLNTLIPPTCHICGSHLSQKKKFLCDACLSQLPITGFHNVTDNPMVAKFAGLVSFEKATASYFYARGSHISSLIHDFKYRQMPDLARFLAHNAALQLRTYGFFNDIDAIMAIPMHIFKRVRRGYNQADYIAKGVAEATCLPIFKNLKSIRSHSTQTHLSQNERQHNLSGSFKVINPEGLADKHILLVDDVCTTGATLTAAAETLLNAQPDVKLSFYTLATTLL